VASVRISKTKAPSVGFAAQDLPGHDSHVHPSPRAMLQFAGPFASVQKCCLHLGLRFRVNRPQQHVRQLSHGLRGGPSKHAVAALGPKLDRAVHVAHDDSGEVHDVQQPVALGRPAFDGPRGDRKHAQTERTECDNDERDDRQGSEDDGPAAFRVAGVHYVVLETAAFQFYNGGDRAAHLSDRKWVATDARRTGLVRRNGLILRRHQVSQAAQTLLLDRDVAGQVLQSDEIPLHARQFRPVRLEIGRVMGQAIGLPQ
jgi:hypothetical protein